MNQGKSYRFSFEPPVPTEEPELTLHLAIYAVEGMFGEARVRMDAAYRLVDEGRAIVVEAGNEVGEALVRVFTRLLTREFGEDAFHVRRAETAERPEAAQMSREDAGAAQLAGGGMP